MRDLSRGILEQHDHGNDIDLLEDAAETGRDAPAFFGTHTHRFEEGDDHYHAVNNGSDYRLWGNS